MRYFLLLFCISYVGYSQKTSKADSLRQIAHNAVHDTTKTVAYHTIIEIYKQKDSDSAFKYIKLAFNSAKKSQNQDLIAQTHYYNGIVLRDVAKYQEAIVELQKAIKVCEKTGNKKKIARFLSSIGLTYKKMGDVQKLKNLTEKALEYGLKSVELSVFIKDSIALPSAYNNLGITYRDLKDFKNAKKSYLAGIEISTKTNKNKDIEAILNSNLGQIYMDADHNYDAAITQFKKGLELSQKQDNLKGIEFNNRNLAEIYRLKKDYSQSVFYGKISIEKALELKDNHRLFNAYKVLSKSYEEVGNYREAFETYKLSKQYEDSTLTSEKLKAIADVEAKYETEKKEILINNLDEKNKIQRNQLIFAVTGLLILAGFIGILLWQYRTIKKSNKLLVENNTIIKKSSEQISQQSLQLKNLMKELHHRVKNNLAIVSNLLMLQSNRLEDENAIKAVKEGQQRVESMSLIHQKLYETDEVASIDMKAYITDLARSLMQAYGFTDENFSLDLNIDSKLVDVDVAIPLGLILNEILTNAYKYAFKNVEKPLLAIYLKSGEDIKVEVKDNGPGIDLNSWKGRGNSFGKRLINSLTEQLGGKINVKNNNGACFNLSIPLNQI